MLRRKRGYGLDTGFWGILIGLLAGGGLSGCSGPVVMVAAPKRAAVPIPPKFLSRTSLLHYINDSTRFDTTHAATETRRLMRGTSCPGTCTYGPLVTIQPESSAASLDRAQLAQGRILARLINRGMAASDSYPKLNLRPGGTVYWWVDSVPTGQWRSLYIPQDTLQAISPPDTFRIDNTGYTWPRSFAKYIWRDTDEALWVTCSQGCCKTSSGGP